MFPGFSRNSLRLRKWHHSLHAMLIFVLGMKLTLLEKLDYEKLGGMQNVLP